MKEKTLIWILMAEAVVCAAAALAFPVSDNTGYLAVAPFPFALFGLLLRTLSLSGKAGNVFAVLLYICLCALPLVPVGLHAKRHTQKGEDWLLFILSAFSFYMMYMMVNPGLLSMTPSFINADYAKAAFGGTWYSILFGYIVIRLLRRSDSAATESLLKTMRLLLAFTAAVIVFGVGYIGVGDLKAKIIAVQSGNTGPNVSLGFTYAFLVFRYLASQVPAVMEIGIFLLAMTLCTHLRADRFGVGAINAANQLAAFSKTAVITIVLSTLAVNIAQIVFAGVLVSLSFTASLPVDSLIVALGAMLMTRFFAASGQLAQDNRLFI